MRLITKIIWLKVFSEKIAVYYEKHTKLINSLFGQMQSRFMLRIKTFQMALKIQKYIKADSVLVIIYVECTLFDVNYALIMWIPPTHEAQSWS